MKEGLFAKIHQMSTNLVPKHQTEVAVTSTESENISLSQWEQEVKSIRDLIKQLNYVAFAFITHSPYCMKCHAFEVKSRALIALFGHCS